jgi:hypothetical protein
MGRDGKIMKFISINEPAYYVLVMSDNSLFQVAMKSGAEITVCSIELDKDG